jgi:hypothetical protein
MHLHCEGAALDLDAMDGDVALRNLVEEVGAVTRQNPTLHGAGHAQNDRCAVAITHLDRNGKFAQHLQSVSARETPR